MLALYLNADYYSTETNSKKEKPMLETEIKALRDEVALLREAVTSLIGVMGSATAEPNVEKEKAKTKPKSKETPKKEPKAELGHVVTRDEIQELCTNLMRRDRGLREKLKDIISSYDGATNLRAVKDENLAELKAKIEAL